MYLYSNNYKPSFNDGHLPVVSKRLISLIIMNSLVQKIEKKRKKSSQFVSFKKLLNKDPFGFFFKCCPLAKKP